MYSPYTQFFFILHHEMRISYLLDYYHHHIYHVCMSTTLVRVYNRVFCHANIISIRLCAYTLMVQYGVHCIGVKILAYPSVQLFLLLALRSFFTQIFYRVVAVIRVNLQENYCYIFCKSYCFLFFSPF